MTWYNDLELSLIRSTKEITNVETINMYKKGPDVKGDHIGVYIMNLDEVIKAYQSTLASQIDDTNIYDFQLLQDMEAKVRFSFYGDNAATVSSEFCLKLQSITTQEILQKYRLSVMRKTSASRVPELRDTKYIERWLVDIVFSFGVTDRPTVDIVTEVSYTDLLDKINTIP